MEDSPGRGRVHCLLASTGGRSQAERGLGKALFEGSLGPLRSWWGLRPHHDRRFRLMPRAWHFLRPHWPRVDSGGLCVLDLGYRSDHRGKAHGGRARIVLRFAAAGQVFFLVFNSLIISSHTSPRDTRRARGLIQWATQSGASKAACTSSLRAGVAMRRGGENEQWMDLAGHLPLVNRANAWHWLDIPAPQTECAPPLRALPRRSMAGWTRV